MEKILKLIEEHNGKLYEYELDSSGKVIDYLIDFEKTISGINKLETKLAKETKEAMVDKVSYKADTLISEILNSSLTKLINIEGFEVKGEICFMIDGKKLDEAKLCLSLTFRDWDVVYGTKAGVYECGKLVAWKYEELPLKASIAAPIKTTLSDMIAGTIKITNGECNNISIQAKYDYSCLEEEKKILKIWHDLLKEKNYTCPSEYMGLGRFSVTLSPLIECINLLPKALQKYKETLNLGTKR